MRRFLAVAITTVIVGIPAVAYATQVPQEKVNICHHTESEQNPWNAIRIDESALETHKGHGDFLYDGPLKENGHPENKDHADDEWCEEHVPKEEPKDVCPNIDGNQETVPEDKELKDGQCVDKEETPVTPTPTPTTPTDTTTIPAGPAVEVTPTTSLK